MTNELKCLCGFRAPELGPHPLCPIDGNPDAVGDEFHPVRIDLENLDGAITYTGLGKLPDHVVDEIYAWANNFMLDVDRMRRKRG